MAIISLFWCVVQSSVSCVIGSVTGIYCMKLALEPLVLRLVLKYQRECKGMILFHILISSHFLLLASIFEFQCFGLFSGLTCPKFMGLEPLCYSYFCAFLGLLSVTWLSHVTLCHVAVICCKMSLICTCLHIFVHICTY